jgi:hypothetical protein
MIYLYPGQGISLSLAHWEFNNKGGDVQLLKPRWPVRAGAAITGIAPVPGRNV